MTKFPGILLMLCWFTMSVPAQNQLPLSCYMRLEGLMDQQKKIIIHLVKVNDSLYGDFNSGEVFGKISTKGKFWLKGWPGDRGMEIKGQFKDEHHVTLTMESAAVKGKQRSFDLVEKYPEGSTPFKVHFETAVKKLIKDPKSPEASLKLALLMPVMTESHAPGIDSVNRIISKSFCETSEAKVDYTSGQTIIASVASDFLDNYVSSNEAMYREMPGASFNWELLKFTHIVYNDDYKLTFYILNYTFTGGAHGLETQVFTSVDIKTGKILTLNDLLKPGYENRLTALLTGKLHQLQKLPAQGKLTESGYFVDEVKPNENFYLTSEGIGFYYNHYDIAPYSFGATDIFLTKEELKGILK